MTTLKIRKFYDRERSSLDLTHNLKEVDDSFGNDTDINNIIHKFKRDGVMMPQPNNPVYQDVIGF